jgi:hypothetical protein
MIASLLSQPVVIGCSVAELLSLLTLITLAGGAYKHLECHQDGCHRLGRFRHGHLKLCHVHHPLVPNDGKVTAEHIAAVTARRT